jgi:hypothetical protein
VVDEVMKMSTPFPVVVERVWDATEEPLREVIVPPAPPASVPHTNVPFDQSSFSVDELHDVKLAP